MSAIETEMACRCSGLLLFRPLPPVNHDGRPVGTLLAIYSRIRLPDEASFLGLVRPPRRARLHCNIEADNRSGLV